MSSIKEIFSHDPELIDTGASEDRIYHGADNQRKMINDSSFKWDASRVCVYSSPLDSPQQRNYNDGWKYYFKLIFVILSWENYALKISKILKGLMCYFEQTIRYLLLHFRFRKKKTYFLIYDFLG